jgi:hypothetical protein
MFGGLRLREKGRLARGKEAVHQPPLSAFCWRKWVNVLFSLRFIAPPGRAGRGKGERGDQRTRISISHQAIQVGD